jgi:hypothetical protein
MSTDLPLRAISGLLERSAIPHMVVGSFAAMACGTAMTSTS